MVTASYINDLISKSHSMAKEKGWWPNEGRDHYEIINLINSEVSEALEELRSGHGVTEIYFNADKPGKPEGFPVELADVAIRAADYAGFNDAVCTDKEVEIDREAFNELANDYSLQFHIADLHYSIATMYLKNTSNGHDCIEVVLHCFMIAEIVGIDLADAIEQKMAYNATRGIRHGRAF